MEEAAGLGGKGKKDAPSFRSQGRLEANIKIKEGVFWKTVSDTLLVMGETNNEASEKWRKRLVKLEEEMREMARRG